MAIAYSRHGCGYPYQACSRCEAAAPTPDFYNLADYPEEDECPRHADPDPSARATGAASGDDASARTDGAEDVSSCNAPAPYTCPNPHPQRSRTHPDPPPPARRVRDLVVHVSERSRCCARDGCRPDCR
jgi:hypothetical protein